MSMLIPGPSCAALHSSGVFGHCHPTDVVNGSVCASLPLAAVIIGPKPMRGDGGVRLHAIKSLINKVNAKMVHYTHT